MKGNPSGMTAEEKAAYEARMNEEVEIKLFRDNDKYKDPVFVGCNGETIAIERGSSTIHDSNKLRDEYDYGKHLH